MRFLFFILTVFVTSCSTEDYTNNPDPSTVEAYVNGKIYTVNTKQPWAEAMLVKEGVIITIGTTKEIEAAMPEGTTKIELNGKMVLPGFHDVHLHPLEATSSNFQFTLNATETDPEKYSKDIEKALSNNKNAAWLLGWGFDIYTIFEADREPIEILDEISTSKPIAIMEQTSHSIWVNSKALEMAGITKNSPNPTGGIIMKDKNGDPNGLLIDNAGNMIIDLAISQLPNNEQQDYNGLLKTALPEFAKNGITSICDARTYWKRNNHLTWKKVADEGKLTVRVNLGLWLYPEENDDTQIAKLKSLYSFDQNSLLKVNQIKLYSDGIIINTTSAMDRNFKINLFNQNTNNGLNYVTQSRITKYIAALEPLGFDFHIHAIGNRGVNEALNAIQQKGTANGRHRLTHVEYVNAGDYSRFNSLNVTADAQVAGDFTKPENWHENDELIDAALNATIIPIKSLLNAKARLTLSSDWDVSDLNPFIGLQNAVTRSPQDISLAEAIKAYTINAAYVMRQETKVGTLEIGKEADFIVLSQNIFDIDKNKINKTTIEKTYLKGRLIFQK